MAGFRRHGGVCGLVDRFSKRSGSGSRYELAFVAAAILSGTLLFAGGCGNQYRPVITPIQPTGPANAPTADVIVASQPGFSPQAPGSAVACAGGTYANPSIFTLVDFSGDSIMNQANGGNGPLTFSMEAGGANVYAPNCDGTLTTAIGTTTSLLTKNVQNSTLLPGSIPTNTLFASTNLYVVETGLHGPTCLTTNCVAQLTGSPEGLKQEIPVAPSLINLTGYSSGERIYAISQGNSSGAPGQPAWGDCDTPSAVAVKGEADAIETTTNTISARLPLGVCPVFGFQTPDLQRAFIMNRGSGTVTVINTQLNAIDSAHPSICLNAGGCPATGGVIAGPVYADYYRNGEVLVTANYDSNTISIIDVSLDQFQNDSATFGTVLATVPVGLHPLQVSVLQDGSRAYVANQGVMGAGGTVVTPGSISVVNLTNYSVEKTIALTSNPHSIGSIYNYPIGKVYVASQNSPYLTIIRTDTDVISATPEMQGNIVEMRVNAQYPAASSPGARNYQTESTAVGSGAP